MRRIAVVCLAVAASMLVGASIASAEEGEVTPLVGCSANVICTYWSKEFNNTAIDFLCSESGPKNLGGTALSATNRCGNKTNWLRLNGSVIACMNPSGERPHPGPYNEVFIAAEFGSFC